MKKITLLLLLCFAKQGIAQNWNHYYGNIHAHSGYSDGNKDSVTSGMSKPFQDFEYAKESLHIDFYGISEHNHYASGMINKQYYYNGVNDALNATVEDTFVAMYGMEWGIIANGGHILIYGYDSLIGWQNNLYDAYVGEYDYTGLWQTINSKPNTFGYLAHPQGSDYNGLFTVQADSVADEAIVGLAFRSGPAFSTNFTYSNPTNGSYWARYTDALKRGYHLGVGLDHDTHNSVFGRSQQGRLGLFAGKLTKNDLLYAFRKMHFYASDDWNFRPDFKVNEQPMGSIITQAGNPTIFIDCIDFDLSETVASIFIYHGIPGSGNQATLLTQANATTTHSFTHNIPDGSTYYYYARILQGDGDEIFTSPIWYTRNDGQSNVAPVANFSASTLLACPGEVIQLNYEGTGMNNTYFWSFSNGATPSYATGSNPVVSFDTTGVFHVTLYVENNAGTSFFSQDITIEGCAGISETTSGFKIYPNPATQELFIETENISEKTALFKVYDAFGRVVKAYPLESKAKQKVDISNIPTGMYTVQLQLNNAQYFEQLWIQK